VTSLKLDKFFIKLEQAAALEQLKGLTVKLRDALSVDHVVYHWFLRSFGHPITRKAAA
jgi:hypothetical protein